MEGKAFSDDGTLPLDSALVEWGHLIEEAFAKIGRPFLHIQRYQELLEETGFKGVQMVMIKRPTNDWPKDPRWKEVGRYCCLNFLEGLEGFTMAPFTRVLGWKPEEVSTFILKVRAETMNRSVHAWQKAWVTRVGNIDERSYAYRLQRNLLRPKAGPRCSSLMDRCARSRFGHQRK